MLGLKNLLALVGLVVVAFAGAGWYLGWYKIGEKTDALGHPTLQIQVNEGQVKSDLDKAKQKVLQTIEKGQGVVTNAPPGTVPPMPPAPPSFELPPLPSLPQVVLPKGQTQVQQKGDSWIINPD